MGTPIHGVDNSIDEVEFVAAEILEKVFQGDPTKVGAATHIAQVAVRAHWAWGDLTDPEPWDRPLQAVTM